MASQVQQIIELRGKGSSYGEIAVRLGVSRNTVKSVCRRHQITQQTKQLETECAQCGVVFAQPVAGRRFCCDTCRSKWWYANRDKLKCTAFYTFTCTNCAKQFTAYGNAARKYCSHSCYIRHRFNTRGGRP